MKQKLEVLKKIANVLNENKIKWNLGASCMLHLREVTDHFEDIDILVCEQDIHKVTSLFKEFIQSKREPNSQYKTKHFIEYKIDDIDVDIMSGFIIVNNGEEYSFPYIEKVYDVVDLDSVTIYLESIDVWLSYYELMGREDKVNMIKEYLDK